MFGSLIEVLREQPADKAVPAAPAVRSTPDFQGLEFLVGGVWIATPMPGTTYNESIQWTLDGQFMTSTQIVCTPPTEATFTIGFLGVDSTRQLILMWGFANTGTYVALTQVKPSPPNTWILEGLVRGLMTRQTMIQLGPQEMQTITATLAQGKWQVTPPVHYRRAP